MYGLLANGEAILILPSSFQLLPRRLLEGIPARAGGDRFLRQARRRAVRGGLGRPARLPSATTL